MIIGLKTLRIEYRRLRNNLTQLAQLNCPYDTVENEYLNCSSCVLKEVCKTTDKLIKEIDEALNEVTPWQRKNPQ